MSYVDQPIVQAWNLSRRYIQRRPLTADKHVVQAFEDVTLSIRKGTTLAIVGESGAGKSSLGRCLALLEKPDEGEIRFEDQDVANLRGKELLALRRAVQFVFQDATTALNPRFTAAEIIEEPLVIQRIGSKSARRERAFQLMRDVGLAAEWANKSSLEFSGGQRQRLAIARALALEPKLLILDEALSNLDLANQELILSLLAELQVSRALTYVHISHDLLLVARCSDEIVVMQGGRIVEQKATSDLFAHPEHWYSRELLQAMPSVDSILLERSA